VLRSTVFLHDTATTSKHARPTRSCARPVCPLSEVASSHEAASAARGQSACSQETLGSCWSSLTGRISSSVGAVPQRWFMGVRLSSSLVGQKVWILNPGRSRYTGRHRRRTWHFNYPLPTPSLRLLSRADDGQDLLPQSLFMFLFRRILMSVFVPSLHAVMMLSLIYFPVDCYAFWSGQSGGQQALSTPSWPGHGWIPQPLDLPVMCSESQPMHAHKWKSEHGLLIKFINEREAKVVISQKWC